MKNINSIFAIAATAVLSGCCIICPNKTPDSALMKGLKSEGFWTRVHAAEHMIDVDLNKKLIGLFPGSRVFEIKFLLKIFLKTTVRCIVNLISTLWNKYVQLKKFILTITIS